MIRERILVISDIHGYLDQFIELLNKVKYTENDKLILLGDYCNGGEKSLETILYINNLIDKNNIIALWGNNEIMLKEYIENNSEIQNQEYLNDIEKIYYNSSNILKEKIQIFLNKLLPYYEINNFIFSHAGVNIDKELKDNTFNDLTWTRKEFYNYKAYDSKICIFGHTPTYMINYEDKIWFDDIYKDKIGIDCGISHGKNLGCLEINYKDNEINYNTFYS